MSARSVGKPALNKDDVSDFGIKQPPKDVLPPPPAVPAHVKDEYFDRLPEEHEEVVYSPPRTVNPFVRVVNLVITFFLVHYLFWFPWLLMLIGGLEYAGVWQAKWTLLLFLVVYIPIVFDGSEYRTGKGWNAARMGSYWLAAHDYAKVEIKRTARLDSNKTYLFAWHPHAILVLSRISVYGGAFERLFPGIQHRTLGATPMFYWLFCRLFSMWMGAVDAGKKTATRVLKAGYSLMVFPGGSREIFTTDPESNTVTFVVKPRKGFVKLALRHGTQLVPVVVFGEKYVYSRWIAPEWLVQFCLKRFKGFPLLVFWGRFFTLLPFRSPLRVVYGAPIEVQQVDEPSVEQVDEMHAKYIKAATQLWHEHKAWGYGSAEKAAKEELIVQ